MNKNLIVILTLATASAMFAAQAPTPAKPAASTTPAATTGKPAVAKKHGVFHKKHAKKAAMPAAKSTATVVAPAAPAAK